MNTAFLRCPQYVGMRDQRRIVVTFFPRNFSCYPLREVDFLLLIAELHLGNAEPCVRPVKDIDLPQMPRVRDPAARFLYKRRIAERE